MDPQPDSDPWPGGTHSDLLAARALVYDPCGFPCSRPAPEPESAEYGAHTFTLDGSTVVFRVARTTPTKVGQFVTLWRRSAAGPIRPFDTGDAVDLFVVGAGGGRGQFVFPRAVFVDRGVVSRDGVGGKRAIRVYPPWVATTSRQAGATQAWQLRYFLPLPGDGEVDLALARRLYRP